ncbi:hypothetical protein [Dysgonomonas sp. 520]|uniref:hypothetical protein n=1 Tax=Dysgonomonas sp. 520 TaxID=2302931 RepID=UPI0013D7898E|nr:hypothetical protein [Dysgonomonas sp. 520]NDW11170.1 hypothetical protein [Dysgonomonas sp. 520]
MSELLNVTDIKEGLPGISKSSCAHYYEAFMVCMHRCQHKIGTELGLSGDAENAFSLHWVDYFDDQIDRTWQDQIYCTDHAAVCLSALLVKRCTEYTIIQRARIGTGVDYWLGKEDDVPFQNSARLEISGIFKESATNTADKRLKMKKKQTQASDSTSLPIYVSIVEFSNPKAILAKK